MYRRIYPWYDTALPRFARFLSDRDGRLKMIDVGANVGDSISLVTDEVDGEFLAIEADERFLPFLCDNVALLAKASPGSTVTCEKCLIDETGGGEMTPIRLIPNSKNAGTSLIAPSKSVSDSVAMWSLDELVLRKYPAFGEVNLIKIDTEGYDFKVLRGCAKLLTGARPALFFEFSPRHLLAVGESPDSIFPYLAGLGYSQALAYSYLGSAVRQLSLDDPQLVKELADHGEHRRTYYDILTVHDSQLDQFGAWRQREMLLLTSAGSGNFPARWR
jgi:FkbM family methyltransferase